MEVFSSSASFANLSVTAIIPTMALNIVSPLYTLHFPFTHTGTFSTVASTQFFNSTSTNPKIRSIIDLNNCIIPADLALLACLAACLRK